MTLLHFRPAFHGLFRLSGAVDSQEYQQCSWKTALQTTRHRLRRTPTPENEKKSYSALSICPITARSSSPVRPSPIASPGSSEILLPPPRTSFDEFLVLCGDLRQVALSESTDRTLALAGPFPPSAPRKHTHHPPGQKNQRPR